MRSSSDGSIPITNTVFAADADPAVAVLICVGSGMWSVLRLGHLAHLTRTGVRHSALAIGSAHARHRRGFMEGKLRLEGLTLTVDSVARAVEFYSGMLGLDLAYNSEPAFA